MNQLLNSMHCKPCEGKQNPLSKSDAEHLISQIQGWVLSEDAKYLARDYRVKNFRIACQFIQHIADLAEAEDHHPDIHLTGYRNVKIVLSTHAIGGLSQNDFILAAKINEIPVALYEKSS